MPAPAAPPTPGSAPVVAPPPGHPRFPLLDSLRAIAALAVMAGHVGYLSHTQQSHGYGALMAGLVTGVPIFFALSGFLLFRPFLAASVGEGPRPRVRDFTRRRLLRIVPAYWLALTLLSIEPGLTGVFTGDWWRYYFFLQIYQPLTRISGLTVAWTLCIEVTFYLALPVYAAITQRVLGRLAPRGRLRAELALIATLGLAALILGFATRTAAAPSLLGYFDWFAFGMGLAVASVATRGRAPGPVTGALRRHPARFWAAAAAVYVIMCAVLSSAPQYALYSPGQEIVAHIMQPLVAVLLVAPAVLGDDGGGWPRRLLGWRGLRWLGVISYGTYLWHLTLATWLYGKGITGFLPLLAATLILTVAAAAASYYLVERPLLTLKDRRRPRAVASGPPGSAAAQP